MVLVIHLFRLLSFLLLINACIVVANTPMGTEIINRVEVTWELNGEYHDVAVFAEASFTVARPKSKGVLTVWELDKGLTDGPFENILFTGADFRRNPFIPLPEPLDTSSLTFDPTPIDRTSPLRVYKADRVRLGAPLFFTLTDPGLNLDPNQVETVVVTITDSMTGDTEELRFYENGPNTGIFTGWINTTSESSAIADGHLFTAPFSVISVEYNETTNQINNLEVNVNIGAIDPYGIVFDSETGMPLSGVEITLLDASTGKPAVVFGDNMASSFPSTIVSGSKVKDSSGRTYQFNTGEYRFPFVLPGTYRIEIKQDIHSTHAAPSIRTDDDIQRLPNAPFSLTRGSRLEEFTIEPEVQLNIDIPMDALDIVQITRTASHSELTLGEFFEYTVSVTSSGSSKLRIIDSLPSDISVIPNTLLVNDVLTNPQVSLEGRRLVYYLPPIAAGETTIVTYAAQLTPPASTGKRLISSSEIVTPGTRYAKADHQITVRDSLGIERVSLLGQISAGGCSGENKEYDLSGIRVLLENGEYVITDSDGRFSFRDLDRRTRVVHIDETTLPDGSSVVQCYASTRHAGSGVSQFVEFQPGMMARVEFYLEIEEVEELNVLENDKSTLSQESLQILDQEWLDSISKTYNVGFILPADNLLTPSEAIDIAYLQPTGTDSIVMINGEQAPAIRKEPTMRSADGRFELVKYRAIRIGEGSNSVALKIVNSDEEVVYQQQRHVLYGLHPAKLDLISSASQLESDGRSQPYIKLRILDKDNIPIRPGTQVTVTVDKPFGFVNQGSLRRSTSATERQPKQRQLAVVDETGSINLKLAPVLEGGTAEIKVATRSGNISTRVPISVPNRPWVLVGLAEGTLAHENIRDHLRREGNIGSPFEGRISLFTEGVISGKWLLSLRYDTAQDTEKFYGIDPDMDYIVYGDRSIQGSAAQSRFPLYIRLRKEDASFLVGDFNTQINTPGISLNQKVTGLNILFENNHWRVLGFTAQTSNRLVEDRFALNGTVGPYQLSKMNMTPYSHNVRLVTVSRNDLSEELTSQTLMPGIDYVINYATNELFLRRPIASFTQALDRNMLIVEYEVDEDLNNAWLSGARIEAQVSKDLTVAATHIQALNLEGKDIDITLNSLEFKYDLTDTLQLSAEELRSERHFPNQLFQGSRREIRADYHGEDSHASAYFKSQQGQVTLTSSESDVDTQTIGVSLKQKLLNNNLNQLDSLFIEANLKDEQNLAESLTRFDGEILLTYDEKSITNSLGIRRLEHTDQLYNDVNHRLLYRGQFQPEDSRLNTAIGIEYSLDSDSDLSGDKVELLLGYDVSEQWQLFNTFEVERHHLSDIFTGRTTLGMNYKPREGRNYRSASSWAGNKLSQGQAYYVGADHQYRLFDGLSASLGVDAQKDLGAKNVPFGSSTGNPFITESFVALRSGLRYEENDWGAGIDNEWRKTDTSLSTNIRLRLDGELTEQWSAGLEAFIGMVKHNDDTWRHSYKVHASAAYRDTPRDPITLLQTELRQRNHTDIESLSAIGSIYHSRYLSDMDMLNLRYGLKYDRAVLRTGTVDDWLNLLGLEYRRDLTEYLDIGLHGSVMYAARTKRTVYSQGLSLGVTPFENGWISVGYNFHGFNDADFSKLGYTDKGPFVQFRMKFDSNSLRGIFK